MGGGRGQQGVGDPGHRLDVLMSRSVKGGFLAERQTMKKTRG